MTNGATVESDGRPAGVTASEYAYGMLRGAIIGGQFAYGARLGEVETSELLGVSRTPLREALRRLQSEGLVTIAPHVGAQVASWTVRDVEEVYEMRICLEPYGAARAATRIDSAALASLTDMCEREAVAIEKRDFDTIRALNADFHMTVMAASGNSRLNEATKPLIVVQSALRTFRRYEDQQMLEHMNEHAVLVKAFAAGNSEWAANAMRTHLIGAMLRVLQDKKRSESESPD